MLTVTLDDELVNKAREVGHHQNDVEAIVAALQEYVEHRVRQPKPAASLQDWVDELYGANRPKDVVETLIAERRKEAYDA